MKIKFDLVDKINPNKLNKEKRTSGHQKKSPVFDRLFFALILATLMWVITSANASLAGDGKTQEMKLSIIKTAVKAGLFDEVKDGDRIISWDMNDATEINKAVFAVESGIDISMLNQPRDFLPMECIEDPMCNPVEEIKELMKFQERLSNGARREISKPANFFQLDVLLYTWNSAVFVLSRIEVEQNQVLVNRNESKIIWVGAKNAEIYGKKIGEFECVKPRNSDQKAISDWKVFVKIYNSRTKFPLMEKRDHGQICEKVDI